MNLIHKLMMAGCCVAAFSSCKKDNISPDDFILFKVNGTYKTIKPEADIFDDNTFLLDAGPFMKNEISLSTDTNLMIKTYRFENDSDNALAEYYDDSGTHFWADSGSLTVKSFDGGIVKGSFSFRAKTLYGEPATIRITEGQFSAKVSYDSFSSDTCGQYYDPALSVKNRMVETASHKR